MTWEAFSDYEEYKHDYAENFEEQTTKEINDAIDQNFAPHTATYLKQQWAMRELMIMAEANDWGIATDALLFSSAFDPTGVLDVIAAYTKPNCVVNEKFPVIEFPSTVSSGPISWNTAVSISTSANNGHTSNCGWFGCRVARQGNGGYSA